jgi:hypothetical protein
MKHSDLIEKSPLRKNYMISFENSFNEDNDEEKNL